MRHRSIYPWSQLWSPTLQQGTSDHLFSASAGGGSAPVVLGRSRHHSTRDTRHLRTVRHLKTVTPGSKCPAGPGSGCNTAPGRAEQHPEDPHEQPACIPMRGYRFPEVTEGLTYGDIGSITPYCRRWRPGHGLCLYLRVQEVLNVFA